MPPYYSVLSVCGWVFTGVSFLWRLSEVESGEAVMGKRYERCFQAADIYSLIS